MGEGRGVDGGGVGGWEGVSGWVGGWRRGGIDSGYENE